MTTPSYDRARWMLEEHEHLRARLEQAEKFFSQEPQQTVDAANVLDELITELKLHFMHEEEGGYLSEALSQAPRFTDRATELQQQHPQMLKAVRELYQQAQSGDGSAGWWSSLQAAYQSLAEQIHAHETGENDLVQKAFTEDIGASE